MSNKANPVSLILAGLAWRFFGATGAGEKLLRAVNGDDEQNRMLAGISLVRAGERSVDLIGKQFNAGGATPQMIRLLPDINSQGAQALLETVSHSQKDELAVAARSCLDLLSRMEKAHVD